MNKTPKSNPVPIKKAMHRNTRRVLVRQLATYMYGRVDSRDGKHVPYEELVELFAPLLDEKGRVRAVVNAKVAAMVKALGSFDVEAVRQEARDSIWEAASRARQLLEEIGADAAQTAEERAALMLDSKLEKWVKEAVVEEVRLRRAAVKASLEKELRKKMEQAIQDFVAQITFKLNAPGGRKLIIEGQKAAA